MSAFKALNAPNLISAGAPPLTPLGQLIQRSPRPSTAEFKGPASKGREGGRLAEGRAAVVGYFICKWKEIWTPPIFERWLRP